MGNRVVLTPGRPQPTSRNGLLSCLNTTERFDLCERNISTRASLVIRPRYQSHAYLQSPIAFMTSWFPKHESTMPPAASACHLSFSMSRNSLIVSSPLLMNQTISRRTHDRHTYLRSHENRLRLSTDFTYPQCPQSGRGSRLLWGSNHCCY
jgi:hypothetical protein